MDFVGTRLGLGSHDSSYGFAELGVIVLGRNLGFSDRIQTRVHDDDTQNRILVVSTIQLISRAAEVLAVHENLLAALGILCGSMVPPEQLRPWRKQLQALEIPIVDGEFRQLF